MRMLLTMAILLGLAAPAAAQTADRLYIMEVCDGLDMKIISRFKAREFGVPVVMDTNDRGMLDIERFDLEPQRPILHGLAGGVSVGLG